MLHSKIICNEFRIIGEIKKVRETLQLLPNGLIVCDIKITNPFCDTDNSINCKAMIDTGCTVSIICQSIFKQFTVGESRINKIPILTVNNLEKETTIYPFKINVPDKSWEIHCIECGILNLTDRDNYQAIIGIDILRNFSLYCDWVRRLAWLEH